MNLILINIETKIAKEVIKDDALEMWVHCDFENKHNAAVSAFYSKKEIQPEEAYFHIEFGDDVHGEISSLQCSKRMHKAMLKHSLYPPIILNAFYVNS